MVAHASTDSTATRARAQEALKDYNARAALTLVAVRHAVMAANA
jgi:hypothetical protein